MSSFLNPNFTFPIDSTTAQRRGSARAESIYKIFPDKRKLYNFDSEVAPGIKRTRLTVIAPAITGHSDGSSVLNICTE